jgi:hypothetical protein
MEDRKDDLRYAVVIALMLVFGLLLVGQAFSEFLP